MTPTSQTPTLPNAGMQARASQAYARQSRESLEQKLIVEHLPLVRHIVQKLRYHLKGRLDYDDLVSAGTLGLVKAARSFDAGKDVEFKTYAYIRIRGAIIDEMRGSSFVPSNVHHEIKRIEEAYRQHATRHGQPPDDAELAQAVDLPLEKMYKILEEGRKQQFLSIHGLNDDKPTMAALVPADSGPDPQQQAERKEMLEVLTQAILDLPERDRHVLLLYYERDLTMKETAEVLGVTESRVSQLHASALFKLAMKLGRSA